MRTNIEIDSKLLEEAFAVSHLRTKKGCIYLFRFAEKRPDSSQPH